MFGLFILGKERPKKDVMQKRIILNVQNLQKNLNKIDEIWD